MLSKTREIDVPKKMFEHGLPIEMPPSFRTIKIRYRITIKKRWWFFWKRQQTGRKEAISQTRLQSFKHWKKLTKKVKDPMEVFKGFEDCRFRFKDVLHSSIGRHNL